VFARMQSTSDSWPARRECSRVGAPPQHEGPVKATAHPTRSNLTFQLTKWTTGSEDNEVLIAIHATTV
jgi:hypothetical protein